MTDKLVGGLIKHGHEQKDIEYGGFLANHLFHGLIALYHLEGNLSYFKKKLKKFILHSYSFSGFHFQVERLLLRASGSSVYS